MWFGIVSLFPEMFQALNLGMTGRALKDQHLNIEFWNPRDFAVDKHKSVDDRPYGGGPGMVMMAEPLDAALQAAKQAAKVKPVVIYLSPQGKQFNQQAAVNFLGYQSIVLLSGRYEGVDERIISQHIDEEWSIGDYILTGGELAAMVMIDSVTRLIPGVLGDQNSVSQDSLTTGLLKHSQFTRPETYSDQSVPDVLLSGHHKQIEKWRLKESLGKTWLRRPDLLVKKGLTKEELALLNAFIAEFLQK